MAKKGNKKERVKKESIHENTELERYALIMEVIEEGDIPVSEENLEEVTVAVLEAIGGAEGDERITKEMAEWFNREAEKRGLLEEERIGLEEESLIIEEKKEEKKEEKEIEIPEGIDSFAERYLKQGNPFTRGTSAFLAYECLEIMGNKDVAEVILLMEKGLEKAGIRCSNVKARIEMARKFGEKRGWLIKRK